MCGIAGKIFLDPSRFVEREEVLRMLSVISHRGPDGEGIHLDGPVGLGHRRLSIIDLSPAGAQPMCNEDGSVWIVFNGEIYNFPDLRDRLVKRGHTFRSATDTEVIVHLYEDHGVDCLRHLRGMFAFAIWDARNGTLFLARDRVGIKPLYYWRTNSMLAFASEMKSLLTDPDVNREINLQALDRFLTYLYLPGDETLLRGIYKLKPGHYLLAAGGRVMCKEYWDLEYASGSAYRNIDDAASALNELLRRTVKDHMISDVPVGFLSSGGVDSTALLSYAVEESNKPIQTFTVGFSDAEFADERPYARLASERFGTVHREITMSADDFRSYLPRYIWDMEEPVCEPPAVALYYVSKLASSHVKVLLSGEGGDEAFGGYPEYRNYLAFERFKELAGPFRGLAGEALGLLSRVDRSLRIRKYAAFSKLDLASYYYSRVTSPHENFNRCKGSLYSADFACSLDMSLSAEITKQLFARVREQPLLNQMLYVDTKSWLPDDLLVKADKITMGNSLELRVPLLDHEVLEFAARLPPEYKVRGRETKRILKRAFRGVVPEEILNRRKTGFPVPFERWLRHELRPFVRETLTSSRALARGYFRSQEVANIIDRQEASGRLSKEIFCLLILELWHLRFVDGAALQPDPAVQAIPVNAG